MAELKDLVSVLQEQISLQQQQMQLLINERKVDKERFDLLIQKVAVSGSNVSTLPSITANATPNFTPFDSPSELWTDYWARFCTFVGAYSIPEDRKAQVFLTNQSPSVYKLLANLASQQTPPKGINELTIEEIVTFMKDQFDPRRFVVRERFRFWSSMERKPGESIQELAARIRADAATCDFTSIKNPQDEALRTRFMCSVNNEAVLKALFKVKDDELDFNKAIDIAIQTEDAAKVARETVHGSKTQSVQQVKNRPIIPPTQQRAKPQSQGVQPRKVVCYRCGGNNHHAQKCNFKDFACNFCQIKGHLEKVCRKKQANTEDKPFCKKDQFGAFGIST